jgi:hypothetical protein
VPYDGAGPTVSLTAPASLVLGVPGDFAVKAVDYWGPLTTTIAYDDGGSGASHAFSTLGAHTATATVTDAAGFTATAKASTTVVKAPATGGTGGKGDGGSGPGSGSASDKRAPKLRLGLKSRQRLLNGLKVTLRSDEAATARLALTVSVRCGAGTAKVRSVSLVSRTVKLAAGTEKSLTLKASKKGKRRLKAAQSCGGTQKATLKVSLTDAAGNVARLSRSVSVR